MPYTEEFNKLDQNQQQAALEAKISSYLRIGDDAVYASCIATTNALGWGVDEYKIVAYQVVEGEIGVNLTYSASGEQEEDHAFLGDSVSGTAVAVVDDDGDVRYEEVTAEVRRGRFIRRRRRSSQLLTSSKQPAKRVKALAA